MLYETSSGSHESDMLPMRSLEVDASDGMFTYRRLRAMLGRAASYGLLQQDLMVAADREGRMVLMTHEHVDRRAEGNRIVGPTRRIACRIEEGEYAYLIRSDYDYAKNEFVTTYGSTDDQKLFEGETDEDVLVVHLKATDMILSAAIRSISAAQTPPPAPNVIQLDEHRPPPNQ